MAMGQKKYGTLVFHIEIASIAGYSSPHPYL